MSEPINIGNIRKSVRALPKQQWPRMTVEALLDEIDRLNGQLAAAKREGAREALDKALTAMEPLAADYVPTGVAVQEVEALLAVYAEPGEGE